MLPSKSLREVIAPLAKQVSSTKVIPKVRKRWISEKAAEAKVPTSSKTLLPGIKINIYEDEKTTYIESLSVPTGREHLLIKTPDTLVNKHACALCRLNLKSLHYTDVLILEQFMAPDGSLLTVQESKLCLVQYNNVRNLIKKAQRCNIIKRPSDYIVPGGWHDLNTYIEPDRKRDQPMRYVKPQYWK